MQVAVFLEREDVISYLISIGANQRHRDKLGRNMVHSLVTKQSGPMARHEPKKFQRLLSLLDKQAVEEMLLERSSQSPGALTPLALWLHRNATSGSRYTKPHIIAVLGSFSPSGTELEMINGEGDLPLHSAIKNTFPTLVAHLLSRNPALLHRENATGRTGLEMARDMWIAACVEHAPRQSHSGYRYYPGRNGYNTDTHTLLQRATREFVPTDKKRQEKRQEQSVSEETKKWVLDACESVDAEMASAQDTQMEIDDGAAGEVGTKRRLVSLFEANEVARRLANGQAGRQNVSYGYIVDKKGERDVVSEWLGMN